MSLLLLLNVGSSTVTASREPLRDTAVTIAEGFDGQWHSHFKIQETAFTRASDRTVEIVNRCHQDGSVAICEQSVDGVRTATMRYRPNTPQDVEVSTVDVDGRSTVTSMHIHSHEWIFPWAQSSGGRTIRYRIVNRFKRPNIILWSEDARPTGGRWRRIGQGLEERGSANAPVEKTTASCRP